MNTIGTERRMTRLARLYAARERRQRHADGSFTPACDRLGDAIFRTKMPYYAGAADNAMALLTAARAADCLS